MGTLTRFELKKMLGGKFFLIALCLMLLVNILLNCGIQEHMEWLEAVEEGIALETAEESISFWGDMAGRRKVTAAIGNNYAFFENLTPEERAAFETAMMDKYGADVFDMLNPTDEMMMTPGYFGEERNDFGALIDYAGLKLNNQTIRETQDRVIQAAQDFGREALEKGDNYGVRRNLQIIRTYSQPRPEVTNVVRGWNDFLFDQTPMLLVFLLLLLACAGSVSGENDRQTWLLLHTAKNGKGKTLAAKYLAGAITAAALTLLFQLALLGAVWFRGGLLGLNQPAALLDELKMLPYPLTVGQYVLVNLVCQIFAAVALSVLLTTVSALSKSSVISYAAGAVLLGVCLLPVYFPPRVEWISGPLSLSVPLKYFDSYYTANLFGFPALWVVVQAVLWSILGAGCVLLAHKVYHRKRGAV